MLVRDEVKRLSMIPAFNICQRSYPCVGLKDTYILVHIIRRCDHFFSSATLATVKAVVAENYAVVSNRVFGVPMKWQMVVSRRLTTVLHYWTAGKFSLPVGPQYATLMVLLPRANILIYEV